MLKLNIRAVYEIISITIKNGAILYGIPVGKNILTYLMPCSLNAMKLIATKFTLANINVIINKLVMVYAKGIRPEKFANTMNVYKLYVFK